MAAPYRRRPPDALWPTLRLVGRCVGVNWRPQGGDLGKRLLCPFHRALPNRALDISRYRDLSSLHRAELEDISAIGCFDRMVEIDSIDDADQPGSHRARTERADRGCRGRIPTRSVRSSSVALTSMRRPRLTIVARPAARRLRTHWTSPHGAHTHRFPETSMIAPRTVVRGAPVLRPLIVKSPFGPKGTPRTIRNFRNLPPAVIRRGALATPAQR